MFGFNFLKFLPWLTAASTAISAYGSYRQGKAAKAAAEYNAKIAEQNAQIAREQSRLQVQQHDREMYLRLGAIRAAQGKSGGQQEGSVLDLLADTAAQGEIERQDIMYRGELSARGYTNTAQSERYEGGAARTAGYLRAGSELLDGSVRTADMLRRIR